MKILMLSMLLLVTTAPAPLPDDVMVQPVGVVVTGVPGALDARWGDDRFVVPIDADVAIHFKKGNRLCCVIPTDQMDEHASTSPPYSVVGLMHAFIPPGLGSEFCAEVFIQGAGWTPESAILHIQAQARVWTNNGYTHVGQHCPDPEPEW